MQVTSVLTSPLDTKKTAARCAGDVVHVCECVCMCVCECMRASVHEGEEHKERRGLVVKCVV